MMITAIDYYHRVDMLLVLVLNREISLCLSTHMKRVAFILENVFQTFRQ